MKKYPGVIVRERNGFVTIMIDYCINGKRFRESAHTDDIEKAWILRCKRIADAADGVMYKPKMARVTFRALFDDLEDYYRKKGFDVETLGYRLQHLRQYFDHRLVVAVGPSEIEKYGKKREKEVTPKGDLTSPGTINREFGTLRAALNRGKRMGKVRDVPYIEFYQEAGPREGHYEWSECVLLSRHMPPELKNLPLIYFLCGWRKMEILTQEWFRVDLTNLMMWIPRGRTKDKKPRIYPFNSGSRMHHILLEQREYTDQVQREHGIIVPWVFHRNGKPIKDFYGAWRKAHEAIKLPYKVPHLLRHSTVHTQNMAQVPRVYGKQVTGHSSDRVYDDYAGGEIESLRHSTGLTEDYLDKIEKIDTKIDTHLKTIVNE